MGYMDVPCFHFASGTQTIYTSEIQKTLKEEKVMTKEDIKKAAAEYAKEACRPLWRAGREQVCMVDFIEGAEWQKNQSPWISTEERLPELNERVLVAQRGINRISICIMKRIPHDSSNPDNKKWHWSLTNDKSEIIAWMPLPHFDEALLKERRK